MTARTKGLVAVALGLIVIVALSEWSLRAAGHPGERERLSSTTLVGREGDLDDVRALVLLRLYALVKDPKTSAVCPADQGRPVTAEVWSRLVALRVPVRALSQCVLKDDDLVDRETGRAVARVSIGSPAATGPREALVEGAYSKGFLADRGYSFTLRYTDGRWTIVSEWQTWIS